MPIPECNPYEAYIKILIDFDISCIKISSTILKNNRIVTIKNETLMQSLSRYLMQLNTSLKWGCVRIERETQQLWQTRLNHLSLETIIEAIKNSH